MNSFDGADRAVELLDTAKYLTGDEFEPVETRASDLEDWFFLKHGLEHYTVPRRFAAARTIGCRIFQYNGAIVAQIMAVTGDDDMLFYIFPSDELGIRAKSDRWQIIEGDTWAGAITGLKENCFMVATRG
ncbi:MAG: hypothetical protein JOY96_07250, partial [Verrucomicrobia bacterium]|nr:hypothetical protein [Verrucomicrobiota bacterium]